MSGGKLARTFDGTPEETALIATSDLLTLKKTIYAANLSEDDVADAGVCRLFPPGGGAGGRRRGARCCPSARS